ncbi:RRM and RGG RNA binding repeats protein [Cryptosporidium ryanae]|uniref:RRM and RGG RNA binding repeats protein n=1 Tax=Cryptosporidium ryanae TaxID=515981 RepID=UPI00351A74AA|nr:RRM and RGG RNA binding repeats protein [Cryptosporidium ryanae]
MENGLCRSRTTRWADVEDDDDDLDMSLPEERMQQTYNSYQNKGFSTTLSLSTSTVPASNTATTTGSGGNSSISNNNNNNNNSGGKRKQTGNRGGNSQAKQVSNLQKDPPYVVKVSNLDYNLQLKEIQEFFRKNGITNIKIKLPMRNGINEGVATIEFSNFSDFSNTICELDGSCIGSRNIRINHIPHSKGVKLDDRSSNFRSGSNNKGSHNNANLNFTRGGNNSKSFGYSNRDLSPDFSIVRRVNNNNNSNTTTSLSTSSNSSTGGKLLSSSNNEDNKSATKSPNSKSSRPKDNEGSNSNLHTELGKGGPNVTPITGKGGKGNNNNANHNHNSNSNCHSQNNNSGNNSGVSDLKGGNESVRGSDFGGKGSSNLGNNATNNNSGNADINDNNFASVSKVNGKNSGGGPGPSNSTKKHDSNTSKDKSKLGKGSSESGGAQLKGQKGGGRSGGGISNTSISKEDQSSRNVESGDSRKGRNYHGGKHFNSSSKGGASSGNSPENGKGPISGNKNSKSGQKEVMKNGIETRNRFAALGD